MPPPRTPASGRGAEAGEEPRNQTKAKHFKHLCRTQSVPGRPPRSPGLGGGDTHGPLERGGGSCQQQRLAVVARGLRWVSIRNSFGARQLLLRWGSWGGSGCPSSPPRCEVCSAGVRLRPTGGSGDGAPRAGGARRVAGAGAAPSSWGGPSRAGMASCPPPPAGEQPRGTAGNRWVLPPPPAKHPTGFGARSLKERSPEGGAAKCFHHPPRGRRGRARLCPSCRTDGAGGRTGLSSCHAAPAASIKATR